MRDMLGNKLLEGSLVYWKDKDIVAQVIHADDDDKRISIAGRGDRPRICKLVLQIALPISAHADGEIPVNGMFRVMDPNQEELLNKALGGTIKQ